jgi:hypothetical protein
VVPNFFALGLCARLCPAKLRLSLSHARSSLLEMLYDGISRSSIQDLLASDTAVLKLLDVCR